MRVKVLGSAAGGGFPQWNCACPNCSGLRSGGIKARPRTQAQVVVTLNQSAWFLLNASPDLRQQILATPELSVTSVSLASPISTILFTRNKGRLLLQSRAAARWFSGLRERFSERQPAPGGSGHRPPTRPQGKKTLLRPQRLRTRRQLAALRG